MAYLVMNFNSRTADLNRLTSEHQLVKAQRDIRQNTKAALEEQIAFATSEAAVYQWAYENHMVRPGDFPVVPVQPPQITVMPTPRPVVAAPAPKNWERWMMLFFDPVAQ
jgi:hypothetical protein